MHQPTLQPDKQDRTNLTSSQQSIILFKYNVDNLPIVQNHTTTNVIVQRHIIFMYFEELGEAKAISNQAALDIGKHMVEKF